MISLRLKASVYIFLCAFILGFITALYVLPVEKFHLEKQPVTTVKELNKKVNASEKEFQLRIDSLQNKNDSLQITLAGTQQLLEQAKQSTSIKQIKVQKLIAKDKPTVKTKWSPENYSIPIFDDNPCECDSLKNEVVQYINENHRKDSLYEIQLATMDSVVWVKDSIIHAGEGLYHSLRSVFDSSIKEQLVLQDENRLLKKQEKRRRVKNRLLGGGLLITAGSLLHFFIQ